MRIKCPHCNGKGFSEINFALNMACGWCMGKGELDLEIVPTEPQTEAEIEKKWENTVWDTDVYLDDIDGKEPMTNEEWFNGLPTTKKSEFMAKMVTEAIKEHTEHGATRCESSIWWDEWLKQPHGGES